MSHNPHVPISTALRWDIFCRVIDNHGDLGVCWRLAADLAGRGHAVRLWVDDAGALPWMAPGAQEGAWSGIEVLDWARASDPALLRALTPADVWIEGFGCSLPEAFIACRFAPAAQPRPAWIDLEYLSAEAYVERSHGLSSPILQGMAAGHTRHFFFPGFTPATGGLLREPGLDRRQAAFDASAWRAGQGIPADGCPCWSLFCYEPAALAPLLQQLLGAPRPERLLVTHGRATAAVHAVLKTPQASGLDRSRLHFLPPLSQQDYDHLLWACECNFVRGEDSLVRALWAGRPWVWQIYPQDDGVHHAKLDAFLEMAGLPADWKAFHHQWNSDAHGPTPTAPLPAPSPADWAATARALRSRLAAQPDLVTRLLDFVESRRSAPSMADVTTETS